MSWLPFFFILYAFATPALKWTNSTQIVERHEFYRNNEVIDHPKNSWQFLFASLYHDEAFRKKKDCVFYRVPGEEPGVLKLKTIGPSESCQARIFEPGDQEWSELKALQFAVEENRLLVHITHKNFEIENWDIPLYNSFIRPELKLDVSSAEYKASKILFLKPRRSEPLALPERVTPPEANQLCHDVGEDCQEKRPSSCGLCPEGWYEIPNGCPQGPKFCGVQVCGLKGRPACRRGYRYQRKKSSDCRIDSSFAFCARGLKVQCQGQRAFCD